MTKDRYDSRGVSADKKDVHDSIKKIHKGLFPNAFCKIVEDRLTGAHETQKFDTVSYGVSDRGASIRIPWQVEKDQKGYLEDRRPNANADPYVIATVMIDTICSAASS